MVKIQRCEEIVGNLKLINRIPFVLMEGIRSIKSSNRVGLGIFYL